MTSYDWALVFVGIIFVAAILSTAALALVLRRFAGHATWIVVVSGLAIPVAILIAAVCFVIAGEPDGPPPGMVLMGNVVVAAILTPITVLVSWLTLRLARRRPHG